MMAREAYEKTIEGKMDSYSAPDIAEIAMREKDKTLKYVQWSSWKAQFFPDYYDWRGIIAIMTIIWRQEKRGKW